MLRRNQCGVGKAGWVVAASLLLGALPLLAQEPRALLDDLETSNLYNFARFVRWPETAPDGAIDICAVGATKSFLDTLGKRVGGESRDGEPLRARSIDRPDEETGCDILFLDAAAHNARAFLDSAAGRPILTVSDTAGFLEHGGMVEFDSVDGRVRFSVNLAATEQSGLVLSSQLLKVAARVTGRSGPRGVAP